MRRRRGDDAPQFALVFAHETPIALFTLAAHLQAKLLRDLLPVVWMREFIHDEALQLFDAIAQHIGHALIDEYRAAFAIDLPHAFECGVHDATKAHLTY